MFEETKINVKNIRSAYLWTTGELLGQLRKLNIDKKPEHLRGENVGELISLVDDGKVSSSTAKEILTELIQNEINPRDYAERNNLIQENDEEYIRKLISKILDSHTEIVERIKSGEDKLVGFLVGEVMKESTASLNPSLVRELILKETN